MVSPTYWQIFNESLEGCNPNPSLRFNELNELNMNVPRLMALLVADRSWSALLCSLSIRLPCWRYRFSALSLTADSLSCGRLMCLQPVTYSHLARSLQELSAFTDQVRV